MKNVGFDAPRQCSACLRFEAEWQSCDSCACPHRAVPPGIIRKREEANNNGGGIGKPSNPKDQAAETRIPLWLCSGTAMVHWALAQFAGLLKYGAWNWRVAGVRTSVYISAIKRHIKAYEEGEIYDPVDGTRHLGNIMACAAILSDAEAEGKLIDDRPPSSKGYRAAVAEGEALMAKLREQYKDRAPRHWTIADTEAASE